MKILALSNSGIIDDAVAAVVLDGPLKAALASDGHNPAEFNRLQWPVVGASRHAHGTLLFTGIALATLTARVRMAGSGSAPSQMTLFAGDEDDPSEFVVFMLPPRPLMIRDGPRLYAVPIVDRRWYLTDQVLRDFNLWGDAPPSLVADSVNGTAALLTYGTIVDALVARLTPRGVAISSQDSTPFLALPGPYDLQTRGVNAAEALDKILSEMGQAFIAVPDSDTYKIVNLDATGAGDVTAWAQDEPDVLISGYANYDDGRDPSLFAFNTNTPIIWTRVIVPATVDVCFTVWDANTTAGANWYPIVLPKTVSTTGMGPWTQRDSGLSHNFFDTMPAVAQADAVVNTAELVTRATQLAGSYMKRFVSGALDLWLAGTATWALGAAVKWIEYIFDGETGYRTHFRSDLNDPILGFVPPVPDRAGDRGFDRAHTWGDMVQSAQRGLARGVITTRTAASGLPSAISYGVATNDGPAVITATGQTPLFRPASGSDALMNAATIGSTCILSLGSFSGTKTRPVTLLACGESFQFGPCVSSATIRDVSPIIIDSYITTRWGTFALDRFGDPLLRTGLAGTDDIPQLAALLTNRWGHPVITRTHRPAFGRNSAPDNDAITMILSRMAVNRRNRIVLDRMGHPILRRA